MKPNIKLRMARLMSHDTSFARLIVSTGLVLLGVAMMLELGHGAPGYELMEEAFPLPFWGAVYAGVGVWGMYGTINRFPYWARIVCALAGMYLWVFITLAQFNDTPLPTRTLLVLPALVELWVLTKTLIHGDRGGDE
jgi:hypothetical protein